MEHRICIVRRSFGCHTLHWRPNMRDVRFGEFVIDSAARHRPNVTPPPTTKERKPVHHINDTRHSWGIMLHSKQENSIDFNEHDLFIPTEAFRSFFLSFFSFSISLPSGIQIINMLISHSHRVEKLFHFLLAAMFTVFRHSELTSANINLFIYFPLALLALVRCSRLN